MSEWDLSFPPSDFLGSLTETQRREFQSVGTSREYRKGECVFRPGAPGEYVYILQRGRAKIYKLADCGKEVILWFCFPGEMFGLAEVSNGGSREVFAQVCSAATVYRVPRVDFQAFLVRHPNVASGVMDVLAGRLRVLGNMLMNLAADDVTSRVVKLLLRLSSRYGRSDDVDVCLDFPLTHQEIADMVGTTRQTVTGIIGSLRRMGALRTEHHCIRIQRQELLECMVGSRSGVPPQGGMRTPA